VENVLFVFHGCGRIHTPFPLKEALMSEGSIPARYRLRVKQRLAIVAFAREHGIKPASRHFGFARRTVRTWLRRWKADGEAGLVPKYPRQRKRRLPATTIDLIRVARTEHQWGAPRTRVWLERRAVATCQLDALTGDMNLYPSPTGRRKREPTDPGDGAAGPFVTTCAPLSGRSGAELDLAAPEFRRTPEQVLAHCRHRLTGERDTARWRRRRGV